MLNLRHLAIWDFARMNFVRTLLSKRKLARLIKSGAVYGWTTPGFLQFEAFADES
jgi:glutamyl-tRNA synthetase